MRQFKATKWLFILMILLSLVISTKPAFAETPKLEIIKMDIKVMPEYDTPDILVIYSFELKNTSDQPYLGEFVWNLPKGSKKYTVVDRSNGDNYVEPTVKHGDKNDQIAWKFTTPLQPGETKPVQIEYYYNNLQGNPDKTFVYEYIPEYPVTKVEVEVLQPKKASNMVVTPEFGQAQPGSDGFITYKKEISNVKPGANVEIKAGYTKSDPNPSVAPLSQQQGQDGQSNGQPPQNKSTSAAIVLLFIAAFVGVIGFIIYKAMNSKYIPTDLDSEESYEAEGVIIPKSKMNKQQNASKERSPNSKLQADKKKLRDALISCRITEDTYDQLLAELNEEEDT